MITVHFVPTPNGHKATIMLEEIGEPYELVRYDLLKGEHLSPGFRKLNPNARLPTLVDHAPKGGGAPLVVFESGAILIYLAEKSGRFLSTEPRRRSLTLQWLMWQMAGLGPMHGQAHHFVRYAPEGQDYAVSRYVGEARRLFAVLEGRLGQAEYLAEDYSIADMAAWPWVRAARLIGLDLDAYPAIKRWAQAIAARPGVISGTQEANSAKLGGGRVTLTPEQWSNLFGENMLAAAEAVAENLPTAAT